MSLGPGALPPFGSVGFWWYLQHPDELSAAPVDSGWLADGTLELSNLTLTLVGFAGSCPRSKTACNCGEHSSTQKLALPSHEYYSTELTESRLSILRLRGALKDQTSIADVKPATHITMDNDSDTTTDLV